MEKKEAEVIIIICMLIMRATMGVEQVEVVDMTIEISMDMILFIMVMICIWEEVLCFNKKRRGSYATPFI